MKLTSHISLAGHFLLHREMLFIPVISADEGITFCNKYLNFKNNSCSLLLTTNTAKMDLISGRSSQFY